MFDGDNQREMHQMLCYILSFFILNAGKTKKERDRKKSSAKMELCWEEIGTRKLTAEWIVKYGGGTRGKVGGGDCAR